MTIHPVRCRSPIIFMTSILSGLALLGETPAVFGDTIALTSVKDNTLIETADGSNSNGLGDGIFSGRTGNFGGGALLRAVLAFDLSAIPAGSTINSASLTLTLLQTVNADQTHTLHRLLANWGEGTSNSVGGNGEPATSGDATWLHTFWPDQFWANPGGDFQSTPSASLVVGATEGPYVWSDPALAADVQFWLDNPKSNFGWLVQGNESVLFTAKKFGSKDNEFETDRPMLTIDYTPPLPCPADINGTGTVNVDDLLAVINAWGPCPPGSCPADIAPLGGNGVVNVDDLLAVINGWGACP